MFAVVLCVSLLTLAPFVMFAVHHFAAEPWSNAALALVFAWGALSFLAAALAAAGASRYLVRRIQADATALIAFFAQANTPDAVPAPPRLICDEFQAIARAATATIARRHAAERALRASETRFRTLVEVSRYSIVELDMEGEIRYANPAAYRMLAYPPGALECMNVTALVRSEEAERLRAELRRFAVEQPEPQVYFNWNRTGDGRWIEVQINWNYKRDAAGRVVGFISVAHDVTDYRRARRLLDGRNKVLEMLARGAALNAMLAAIVEYIERIAPDLFCAIHLYDAECGTLSTAAALRMPAFYTAAVEGVRVGFGIGSCGTAVATGTRVVVADVLDHPYWRDFRALMQRTPFRACWSQPILGRSGQVLGTFAIYTTTVGEPDAAEIELIESAASLAAIVIEHARTDAALRHAEAQARLLLESTLDGMLGLDEHGNIRFVNPAAARMLGYRPEELVGRPAHTTVHGALADGAPLAPSDCRILAAARQGEAIQVADEVFWRRDGSHFPVEYSATPIRRDGHSAGVVVSFRDIGERQRAEREIRHLAFHDTLTGLPNRLLFREKLKHAVATLRRNGQWFALHLLDLDHFKDINDTLGHPVGDALLQAVATRICGMVRESDTFARLGGDEFALIQERIASDADAAQLADKLVAALSEEFTIADQRLRIGTSIGVVVANDRERDRDADELIVRADIALYKAKESGRGHYAFFEDTLIRRLQDERMLFRDLSAEDAFTTLRLEYQPQIALSSGALVGVEALLRWSHHERGLLGPEAFFAMAEKRGLLRGLSDWALGAACRQARQWHACGYRFGRIAVNFSAPQFVAADFAERFARLLEETAARPEHLTLELTTDVLMEASEHARRNLARLAEWGIALALDDFGHGCFSLPLLRACRIGQLHLSRALVARLPTDRDAAEVVRASIALSQTLALVVQAEGVETPAQAEFLRQHGCAQAQGFLYAPPMGAKEFERRWLQPQVP